MFPLVVQNTQFLSVVQNYPFKRQFHKMVKHTQTIRGKLPTNCLSGFDHFVGLAFQRLRNEISS